MQYRYFIKVHVDEDEIGIVDISVHSNNPDSGVLNPDLSIDSQIDLQTEEVETTIVEGENGNFVS